MKKKKDSIFKALAGANFPNYKTPISPNIMNAIAMSYNQELDRDERDIMKQTNSEQINPNFQQAMIPNFTKNLQKPQQGNNINWGQAIAGGLALTAGLIPEQRIDRYPVVQPQQGYNPHPYGTKSQAIMKAGGKVKKAIAGSVLGDGNPPDTSKLLGNLKRKGRAPVPQWLPSQQPFKDESGVTNLNAEANEHPLLKAFKVSIDKTQSYEMQRLKEQYTNPYATEEDRLQLSQGKFRGAQVPRKLLDDAYGAAQKAGIDPLELLSLIGQESTFGQGANTGSKERGMSKLHLVSGWNLDEQYRPYPIERFLADQKVPGISAKKDIHGYQYSIDDYEAAKAYIDKNPTLLDKYNLKLNSTPQMSNLDYFYEAANRIKTKGLKSYNPGDPDYVNKVNNSKQLLMQDQGIMQYLKSKKSTAKMEAGGRVKVNNFMDGGTIHFNGPSHEDGGIPLSFGGKQIEVEGGEIGVFSPDGTLNIMGNMVVPGTNTKFKTVSKKISKQEERYNKLMEKGSTLVNSNDPHNKFQQLKFNAGEVMMKGGQAGQADLAQKKQVLSSLQEAMLTKADDLGLDPISFSEGGKRKAKNGAVLKAAAGLAIGDPIADAIQKASEKYGVSPDIIRRLVQTESQGNVRARSGKGALGVMQFMPETAKQYGLSAEDLTNPAKKEAVIDAGVKHFKSLLDKNKGDTKLALAAYNGGQGSVNFVKKQLGKKNITGDEWVDFMSQRQASNPSDNKNLWQTQTLDYVNKISGTGPVGEDFTQKYYDMGAVDGTLPEFVKSAYKLPKTQLKASEAVMNTPNNPAPANIGSITDNGVPSIPSDRKGMSALQVLPELLAFAGNRERPVNLQQYNPQLLQDYEVSLQDRRNQNTTAFNALTRQAQGNPTALSSIAASLYDANNQVSGEEFRVNQGISNQVTNQNNQLLNDAQLKNLGLADQQYVRQETANSKTRAQNQLIANSLAGKYLQHGAENRRLGIYENLYDYRYDQNGKAEYMGPDAVINFGRPSGQEQAGNAQVTERYDAQGKLKSTTKTTPSAAQQEGQLLQNQTRKQRMGMIPNLFRDFNRSR